MTNANEKSMDFNATQNGSIMRTVSDQNSHFQFYKENRTSSSGKGSSMQKGGSSRQRSVMTGSMRSFNRSKANNSNTKSNSMLNDTDFGIGLGLAHAPLNVVYEDEFDEREEEEDKDDSLWQNSDYSMINLKGLGSG